MNKFVISALVLSATSSLAIAGSETKEWSSLDRDIENLASSLAAPGPGFGVGGFVRARFANSGDVDLNGGASGGDLSGFSLGNTRLNFSGSVGDYGVFVSFDLSSNSTFGTGSLGGLGFLEDAYATFPIGSTVTGRMGQFRRPFLWSSLVDENNLLFLDRSFNGDVWDGRDNGIQVSGSFEQLGWWIAMQNGGDGLIDDYQLTGRIQFNALGTGIGMQEGAYGASADSNLTIGLGWTDDGSDPANSGGVSDSAIAVDAGYTRGGLSVHAEIVDYDDNQKPDVAINGGTGVAGFNGSPIATGSETPWAITVGYMVTPNEYELAARYEDLDDDFSTSLTSLGVNRYVQGHNAKWTLQWTSTSADTGGVTDTDTIGLGLTVGV
jgi:phosphate-selective porin O/P